jgi:hypothetical protein
MKAPGKALDPGTAAMLGAFDMAAQSPKQYAEGTSDSVGVVQIATPCLVRASIAGRDDVGWHCQVVFEASDIQTGDMRAFSRVFKFDKRPTLQQIADCATEQVRHEIEEQLGLDPHAKDHKSKQ